MGKVNSIPNTQFIPVLVEKVHIPEPKEEQMNQIRRVTTIFLGASAIKFFLMSLSDDKCPA